MELPLKSSPETFVDEPNEVTDVNIHDLSIDLSGKQKDINKLFLCEAIAVLSFTLQDLLKLQNNPPLFDQARSLHLKKHNIVLNDEEGLENDLKSTDIPLDKSFSRSPSPPPAKIFKADGPIGNIKETTPDSLTENSSEGTVPDLQDLINSTDLNDTYAVDFQDIKSELIYYRNPKVKAQISHLIKAFDLISPPKLDIVQFLTRIKTYLPAIAVSCYINAAFLIHKLAFVHNVIQLTPNNVHRLILALIRCLTKILEDIYQKQKTFSTVGGVSPKDLSRMEVGFLFLCNFKLVVQYDSLNGYLQDFTELRNFVKQNIDNTETS